MTEARPPGDAEITEPAHEVLTVRSPGAASPPLRTEEIERRVKPYGLVLKAGRWYLVADGPSGVNSATASPQRYGP